MNFLEPIETFEGGGMVLQGDTEVGPARYYLVVQREMLDHGDADAEKPGMYRISGLVELRPDDWTMVSLVLALTWSGRP